MPINPPKASISRTICPLAKPPMEGLQLIWAMVSKFCVISNTDTPFCAAIQAASQPACPPPQTMTSNNVFIYQYKISKRFDPKHARNQHAQQFVLKLLKLLLILPPNNHHNISYPAK